MADRGRRRMSAGDDRDGDQRHQQHALSQRPRPSGSDPTERVHARWPPWALKKFTRNVAPPIRNAAARATNTPDLPLPATCGLPECDPMAHAIAEIAIPATAATSPNVSRAPPMDSKEAIPAQSVRFGWMLTSLTSMLITPRVHQAG